MNQDAITHFTRPHFLGAQASQAKLPGLANRILLLGLCLVWGAAPLRADQLAPLGAWFTGYQRLTFDSEVAWGHGAYLVSHYSGKLYEPFRVADLPHYSAVLIGSGAGRTLSTEEQAVLRRWVEQGGRFLIAGAEGRRLFGPNPPAWLGIAGWWAGDKPIRCARRQTAHPLGRGLASVAGPAEQWDTTTAALPGPKAVNVLGTDKYSLLLVEDRGKGKIVYLGGTLTPQERPAYREKEIVRDLTPLARRLWENLPDFLGIPRRAAIIRQWADRKKAAAGIDQALVCWWRHQIETPLGARLYTPPHPLPGDEIRGLPIDLGVGERFRRAIFVTSLHDQSLTVTATGLASGDHRLPAAALRLFLQETPLPGYPKASYWLAPLNGPAHLAAGEAYTFWIVAAPGEVRPGTYRGAIEFRTADAERRLVHRLPVRLKVWDVRYPSADVLHYEMEHCWFVMPGGYWIEKDRTRRTGIYLEGKPLVQTPLNDPEVLGNYLDALGELEVDVAQSWGDVAKLYPLPFLRLRADGKLLAEEVRRHPERFRGSNLPALDFSAPFDAYWDRAIPAGMRLYAMNYLRQEDGTLSLARLIAGEPSLAAESDLHRRVRTWYWGEYAKYVRERGVLGVYTKILDEFEPAGVPEFLASARAIRAASFKVYTTTYNFDREATAVRRASPFLDLWQVGWEPDLRGRFARQGTPLRQNQEVWGTTAGSYWGNTLDYPRGAGWVAAAFRYQGLHTHGYMRWYWNDHEGCLVGPAAPFQSVTVTQYAQGMTEGRYLAQLYRLIDDCRRSPKTEKLAAEVAKEVETKVIGTAPDCLIRLRNQPDIPGGGFVEYWWPEIGLSPAVYEQAKVRVFQLTRKLRQNRDRPGPVLRYGDFPLVCQGAARASLHGNPRAVKSFEAAVRHLTGVALPRLAARGREPAIFLGARDHPVLGELVKKELAGEITATYPGPGHYAIRLLPATPDRPRLLLVVGGDAAGTDKGVRNLIRLLTWDDAGVPPR